MSINTCQKSKAQCYKPIFKQNYRTKLIRLLKEELSLQGKPKILELLADEIEKLNEDCYPKAEHMRLWQVRVLAPAVEDKPAFGQKMEDTLLRAVTLTIGTEEDIKMLGNKSKHCEAQEDRLARIAFEAKAQGGLISQPAAALLLGIRQSCVSKYVRAYQKRTGKIIPLRGVVHDIGKSTTHKKWVVTLYEKGYTEAQIVWITGHSLWSVGRYLKMFKRIRDLYNSLKAKPTVERIAKLLGVSGYMVWEYFQILKDLGKIDGKGKRNGKHKTANVFRAPTKYEIRFCEEGKAPETVIYVDRRSQEANEGVLNPSLV